MVGFHDYLSPLPASASRAVPYTVVYRETGSNPTRTYPLSKLPSKQTVANSKGGQDP